MDLDKKMTDVHRLQQAINEEVVGKNYIDKGVHFFSKYYGVIQATRIDNENPKRPSIYGFDLVDGLPRSCYFPNELEWLGFPIDLEMVIQLLNKKRDYFNQNYDVKENLVEITFDATTYFEWNIANGLEFQNPHTIDMLERIVKIKEKRMI